MAAVETDSQEKPVEPGDSIQQEAEDEVAVQTDVAQESMEETAEAVVEVPGLDSEPQSDSSNFEAALQSSLSWIESNEGSLGTIQIMSIGFNQFSTRNYFRYLDSLRDKGVDISQIRVFPTRAGDTEVYTIIYGQYPDRRVAFRSIEGLPEELRANAPIPRTLAGILGEIDQLNQ